MADDMRRQLAQLANLVQDAQNEDERKTYEEAFLELRRQMRGEPEPEEEPEEEPTGGASSKVQSVAFDKDAFTEKQARKWLKKHGFKSDGKIHETKKNWRFRQKPPSNFTSFRAERLKGNENVIFVYGF